MKNLVIFTKLFPFGKTEAFLESEILILAQYFDDIKVCPAYTDSYLRDLPKNVSLDTTFSIDFNLRKKTTIKAILTGKFLGYLKDHITQIKTLKDISNLVRYATYEIYYDTIYKNNNINFTNSIVYSYWFSYIVNAFVRIKIKYNESFKIVTRAHRWDIYEEGEALFPYRQHSIDYINAIYSISMDGKQYLKKKYKNDAKIKVSRLGVLDNGVLSKKSSKSNCVFVTVSQITHRKRIFLVFKSIVEYASLNPSINFSWIHFGTGEQKENLEKLVLQKKLKNLKVDLKGYVNNKDIYNFYAQANLDVFLNLSESEGVPVSIMEAQSYGIPVIATDVGGTSEIVNNNLGFLLPSATTLKDVVAAIDIVVNKDIDRKFIKENWKLISDYQKNYKEFAKELNTL